MSFVVPSGTRVGVDLRHTLLIHELTEVEAADVRGIVVGYEAVNGAYLIEFDRPLPVPFPYAVSVKRLDPPQTDRRRWLAPGLVRKLSLLELLAEAAQ